MRALVQRVSSAKVSIDDSVYSGIKQGFMVLVGVGPDDTQEDVDYLVHKISNLRVFSDDEGKMNLNIKQVNGSILSISQFTLFADTKHGNRPSFTDAADPELGEKLYEAFNSGLAAERLAVANGVFGADMQVSLTNDGPVTIMIDSKDK